MHGGLLVQDPDTEVQERESMQVVCGEPTFDDEQRDTLLNPTVLVEVLSKSTASYDRGEKFEHYRKIKSLVEYLVVAQDKYHVEHYTRQPDDRWRYDAHPIGRRLLVGRERPLHIRHRFSRLGRAGHVAAAPIAL